MSRGVISKLCKNGVWLSVELPQLPLVTLFSVVFRAAGADPDTHSQPVVSLSSLAAEISGA